MNEPLKLAALGTYAVLFLAFTITIGWFLRSRGKVFLTHTFRARPEVASAAHFLLNLGYYLTCGALLLINLGIRPENGYNQSYAWWDAVETVTVRLGICVLVVATFHTANILILSVLNRGNRADDK